MKTCTNCRLTKDESEFSFRNKTRGTYHSHCKVCVRNRDKDSYSTESRKKSIRKAAKAASSRLRTFIETVKKSSKCLKCEESRWYVLEFHHRHGKEYNIAAACSRGISIETLKKELDKCDLLCANCHRELHYLEKQDVA